MTLAEVENNVPGELRLTTPRKQKFVLRYDPKKWTISTDYPSNEGMEYSSFKTKWGGSRVQRVLLTNKDLKAKDTFEYVIERK